MVIGLGRSPVRYLGSIFLHVRFILQFKMPRSNAFPLTWRTPTLNHCLSLTKDLTSFILGASCIIRPTLTGRSRRLIGSSNQVANAE